MHLFTPPSTPPKPSSLLPDGFLFCFRRDYFVPEFLALALWIPIKEDRRALSIGVVLYNCCQLSLHFDQL